MPSSFARAQLEKFGWTDGQGLGKQKQGISEAISVSMKQDTHGLGKDKNEWSFEWWNHAFNKACVNIDVSTEGDSVTLRSQEQKEKKAQLYGSFVKTGEAVKDKDYSIKITDEELLRACEGRTARKGARIDQSAKLKRADEVLGAIVSESLSSTSSEQQTEKKKKKKRSRDEDEPSKDKKKSKKDKKEKKKSKKSE